MDPRRSVAMLNRIKRRVNIGTCETTSLVAKNDNPHTSIAKEREK
jgi:hypothetical protein